MPTTSLLMLLTAWALIGPVSIAGSQPSILQQRDGTTSTLTPLARIIHECRREAFETEARRGCSHVRPTQAYLQSVEEAEREQPRRAKGSDAGAGIHE